MVTKKPATQTPIAAMRHGSFTGADEPYERLKRVLRAEIDEGRERGSCDRG